MNIEELREYCLSLKGATEDVKWEVNLCFCIGAKMFCVVPLNDELRITFKVRPEEFEELVSRDGIIPAPHLARAKWISVHDITVFTPKELKAYIKQSYELVKAKLPKKALK